MRTHLILFAAALIAAGTASAVEVYRWVDKDGKVHYSDIPPPPTAKDAELKRLGSNAVDVDKLSYGARDAAKKNPVTLYATNCGQPCDDARKLLAKRGIPFSTKNPEASKTDADALKKLVGALEVPVLVVGSGSPLKGFEAGSWQAALDAAGYPKTALIAPPRAGEKPAPAAAPESGASEKAAEQPSALEKPEGQAPAAPLKK